MAARLAAVLLVAIAENFTAPVHSQSVGDATALLQDARDFGESTRTWRAEVVESSRLVGPGMNLQDEVRIKIAAQPSLKMRRQHSGRDRTVLVCDGAEAFYSGDGHSYYKGEATVNPDCDFPLIKFYNLHDRPDSVSVVGDDHVRLTDGERRCVVIRAVWKQGTGNAVHSMCIDPSRPLILRDVLELENENTGIRSVTTTTFVDFETNPTFSPETFQFQVPPGAVEVKPPI